MTPRYLYVETDFRDWEVRVLSALRREITKFGGVVLLSDHGKSMRASLDNLNGELCVSDQWKPPPGHSIMFLRMLCVSSRVSAMTRNMESSTKLKDASFQLAAVAIRGAL